MPKRTHPIALFVAILFAMVLSVAVALVGVAANLSTPLVAGIAGVVATVLVPIVYRGWTTGEDA